MILALERKSKEQVFSNKLYSTKLVNHVDLKCFTESYQLWWTYDFLIVADFLELRRFYMAAAEFFATIHCGTFFVLQVGLGIQCLFIICNIYFYI